MMSQSPGYDDHDYENDPRKDLSCFFLLTVGSLAIGYLLRGLFDIVMSTF